MDTKSNRSKKTLLLRDFVVDEDERFVYGDSKYNLIFYNNDNPHKPKRFIEVWYKENDLQYLKEKTSMDWGVLKYRWQIDERNKTFWKKVNKFYEDYFNER